MTRKHTGCTHPPARLYSGVARDDTKPGGKAVWIGCMDCGTILTQTTAQYVASYAQPGLLADEDGAPLFSMMEG
jgi:hypothetical protein